jgi:hypothetical protein
MGKLSFAIKRLIKMDVGRMWRTAGMLREKAGHGRLWLVADMARCAYKYNAGYMDYKIAQMYRLDSSQRATVITRGISNSIVRRMNDKDYWHFFDDKTQFNQLFGRWVARGWLKAGAELNIQELSRFLSGRDAVLYKPLEGSSGQGIIKYTHDNWRDLDLFMRGLRAQGDGILEELVVQHTRMSALCPTSVNTVRIATLLGDKQEGIVYAFLRIGNGKIMDNVDCGGMAARVDLETGKLLTVAADKLGNVYEKHPMTGADIVGFQIPFFKEAREMCLLAMRIVPQVRFVAWDVAITEQGPCFIEGNSFPSHAIPQFAAHYPDGIGILPEFEKFITL